MKQFPQSAILFNIQGAVLKGLGQLDHAIEAYNKALAIKPDYAEAYYNMGVTLQDQGKLEEAIEAYNKALAIKPDYADAYYNMGVTLQDQGKLEEAIEAYNKALAIKPDYAEAYNNMGNALQEQGKLEEAIEAYNKALAIKPDYAEAYYNMGVTLQDQGKLEEAIEAYNKALAIKPDYAEAYNNMGVTLKEQGKLEEAIEAYNKALAIKPDYAEAYNNMGVTLQEQGKLEEAIEAYNKALAIKPDYAEAYNNMGDALKEQGKLEEAIEAYNKALAIKPDYAEAARNLVKLPIGCIDEKTISELNKKLSLIYANFDASQKLFFEANLLSHKAMYEEAFKIFINSNYLKSVENILSVKNEQKEFDAAFERISRWSVNPQSEQVSSSTKLFLLGPSRSGKSTLEKLLIGSPNVFPMFENINLKGTDKSERSIEETRKPSMMDLFYHDENSLLKLGYNVVTSTKPDTMFHIDHLIDLLSNSFCIFVKRNHTDIASEIFTREYTRGNFYSYDSSSILKYLDTYEAIWEILRQKVPHLTLEISFEDILSEPLETIKKISQMTGVSLEIRNPPNRSITNLSSPFREHYASYFMAS